LEFYRVYFLNTLMWKKIKWWFETLWVIQIVIEQKLC